MDDYTDNAPDTSAYSFPHLDDTPFPMLNNIDVYKYENDFDYDRWTDSTKIHLCNVLWNSDYKDVVKFDSDDERDAYFDSLNGYKVDLTTAFHIAPDGSVKVPIPYQVATRYNYMFVDLPIMTSEEEPINYENPRRTQRYYYFIDALQQNAPSSTTLLVSPDNWTTYINNIEIPYMVLERGHAPLAVTDVETYLANPIANNDMLLAPDYDFANGSDIVADSRFVPINNGAKYILFATTMSLTQVVNQKYPTPITGVNTPPKYEDAELRYGYQYIVNDYEWGIGGYDYNGMYTESTPYQSANNAIPNNMTMIACPSNNASIMFAYMSEHIPFFFKTIKACFMVDDTMFTKGQAFSFCNVTCYAVLPAADSLQQVLADIILEKDDFGYDDNYSDLAKLYTFPYARIEVTDNNGNTKTFKIENTSNIQVRKATSIAFPYLSIQAYITGINGNGYSTYSWKQLDNTSQTRAMFDDDFGDYLWDWDIPTYSLFVRGYDEYKASNYPNQEAGRYNAIAEYHKQVGSANTEYENAKDAANNTNAMTHNSNDSEYNNSLDMNNRVKSNNDASANTAHSNAYRSANTAESNADENANLSHDSIIRQRSDMNSTWFQNNLMAVGNVGIANDLSQNQYNIDSRLTLNTALAEAKADIITGAVNGVGQAISGASSAAAMIGTENFLGGVGASIEGQYNAAAAAVTTFVGVGTSLDIATMTVTEGQNKVDNTVAANNDVQSNVQLYGNKVIGEIHTATLNNQAEDVYETITQNADRTRAMEKSNADATQLTSLSNNLGMNNTANANALRTKDVADTNADLNANLTKDNAHYTRNINVHNSKITLNQKQYNNQLEYYASRLNAPVQYGSTSGDSTLDAFERRGLQVKVRTQNRGHIRQAGDMMLRYGYALNQVWDVNESGLNVMEHFSYWKAADLWINEGTGVNQDAQRDIQSAFESGVTVWRNPDEIGKVSIYDN